MRFPLVSKLIVNDLERRNGRYFALFPKIGTFGAWADLEISL